MESNCIKFMGNTKAGRAVSILEGRAAVQRNLCRLAIWFDWKILMFNKGKHEISALHPLPT